MAIARQAVWSEENLHGIGAIDTPMCRVCGIEAGTLQHHLWQCGATVAEFAVRAFAGEVPTNFARLRSQVHPLVSAIGLPPLLSGPRHIAAAWKDTRQVNLVGEVFRDGAAWMSFRNQVTHSVAATITLGPDPEGPPATQSAMLVPGWFQSAYRAEARAIVNANFAARALSGPRYIGDCLGPLRAIGSNDLKNLASPTSFHADIYRQMLQALIHAHGTTEAAVGAHIKTKAHRSLASRASGEEPLSKFYGNGCADSTAKNGNDLCRTPSLKTPSSCSSTPLHCSLQWGSPRPDGSSPSPSEIASPSSTVDQSPAQTLHGRTPWHMEVHQMWHYRRHERGVGPFSEKAVHWARRIPSVHFPQHDLYARVRGHGVHCLRGLGHSEAAEIASGVPQETYHPCNAQCSGAYQTGAAPHGQDPEQAASAGPGEGACQQSAGRATLPRQRPHHYSA